MKTSIERAGRVVIPAAIRERAGLVAGAELEVTVDDTGVRLERVASGPRLVKIGRRLVARPTGSPERRQTWSNDAAAICASVIGARRLGVSGIRASTGYRNPALEPTSISRILPPTG